MELVTDVETTFLSNGFARFHGIEVYHVLMYVLFLSTSTASVLLIKNWHQIKLQKVKS